MNRVGKLILFLSASILFLTAGIFVRLMLLLFRQRVEPTLVTLSQRWAGVMLRIIGITVSVHPGGAFPVQQGSLIAANHQSYLDIIVLASVSPMLFVAKSDVRSWPILGWLASIGGTLFIDRKSFRGPLAAASGIEQALKDGLTVQIFPEATSTNGSAVLPFRSFLFNAAVAASRPVQPVTVNYCSIDGIPVGAENREIVCWYGDMNFIGHFWELLKYRKISVSVTLHPVIDAATSQNPKVVSELAWRSVRGGFLPLL
jgi:1-acyl-sn-glycerol-3-phosphate acyltransferase